MISGHLEEHIVFCGDKKNLLSLILMVHYNHCGTRIKEVQIHFLMALIC
jgi:hypothetical protein